VANQEGDLVKTATRMFVYGYPLVASLHELAGFTSGGGSLPVNAPFNEFAAARELLGPETTFVSPNNDTLYLLAAVDVRPGPLVLGVPDTGGRYYVIQFVDAWTNNFAYVGRRATGTAAREFLLVGPGDATESGLETIRVPTGVASLVGRIQINGPEDAAEVHALQDSFRLTPLHAEPAPGLPEPDPRVAAELRWWETFRVQLAAFPPPPADAPMLEPAATLGLTAPESPYVDPGPELREALIAGERAGREQVEALATGGAAPAGGWVSALHSFDYNSDHLGLGTIDAPEWRIDDREQAYAVRAGAARGGLYGNHGYEADYEMTYVDAGGEQLTGEHRYELRLTELPPVDAFWSMTMYDVPDFLLVANPIDRYSIGDRTPGLRYGDDGSLTLYLQHESPGPEKESNWLPTPAGAFRPIMRLYQPRPEVLSGAYRLPPIERVGSG